jgi:hypothetical protein
VSNELKVNMLFTINFTFKYFPFISCGRGDKQVKTSFNMAILSFQKPDKIVLQKANDFEGQFEFRPLEPGFGLTIGNALRRVLLSSLEGFAW